MLGFLLSPPQPNDAENGTCRKCGFLAKIGYSLLQKSIPSGTPDFVSDTPEHFGQTMVMVHSPNELMGVLKCTNCGHSWKPQK
jgi:hypothetical protein